MSDTPRTDEEVASTFDGDPRQVIDPMTELARQFERVLREFTVAMSHHDTAVRFSALSVATNKARDLLRAAKTSRPSESREP